jgi:uncharacterized protein YjbI with pentapeptide repeats
MKTTLKTLSFIFFISLILFIFPLHSQAEKESYTQTKEIQILVADEGREREVSVSLEDIEERLLKSAPVHFVKGQEEEKRTMLFEWIIHAVKKKDGVDKIDIRNAIILGELDFHISECKIDIKESGIGIVEMTKLIARGTNYFFSVSPSINMESCQIKRFMEAGRRVYYDNVYIIFESNISLQDSKFEYYANFFQATFKKNVKFRKASFNAGANFEKASFNAKADFEKASFNAGASFEKASFNAGANFNGASFSGNVNFIDANLSGADLRSANLSGANLSGANLSGTDLRKAKAIGTNFRNCYFDPKNIDGINILGAKGFSSIKFNNIDNVVNLRNVAKNAGFKSQERQLTAALRKKRFSVVGLHERIFENIFLDYPTDYGANPWRCLEIFGAFFLAFSIPYMIVLKKRGQDGIFKVWSSERARIDLGEEKPVRLTFIRGFSFFWYGLYFSLLSAFHIGWRDLNVGSWIARIQPREYTLKATGWVRVVSGVHSFISIYLLALWALTYFSRPFE